VWTTAWRSSRRRSRYVHAQLRRTPLVDPRVCRGMRLALRLPVEGGATARVRARADARPGPATRRSNRSKPRVRSRTRASIERKDDDEDSVHAGGARGVAPDPGRLPSAALGGAGAAPPPAAPLETVPAQPSPSYVWVPGAYTWQSATRTYVWVRVIGPSAAGIRLGARTLGDSSQWHGVGRWTVASGGQGCTVHAGGRLDATGRRTGRLFEGSVTGPGPSNRPRALGSG
jgi:hypothetical protein